MDLILDVKILIALDEDIWIKFVLLDDEFKQYAYKKEGINKFREQFTKKKDDCTYLFGKLHSINDLPAENYASGNKYWYYDGKKHRENDLPVEIYANGTKYWYYDGKEHRENDLPAEIYADGDKHWYYDGKRHRENDSPAIIFSSGTKYWYYNGIQMFPNIT